MRFALFVLLVLLTPQATFAAGDDDTRLTPVARHFSLKDTGIWEKKRAIIRQLVHENDLAQHSLGTVLRDANRRTKERSGKIRLYQDRRKRMRRAKRYDADHWFTWDQDDRETTSWYPQGMSGSADAFSGGTLGGRRVLVVSWYAKKNRHKGARISVVDVTDPFDIRYRHLLLVEPVTWKGRATFRSVVTHAGGIVLYKNLLYVADTGWGVRVFDTNQIFETRANPAKDRIGIVKGEAYAFDYRYALPMVGRYRQPSRADLTFSFISLDRTRRPHGVWAGEYEPSTGDGYATRFPLNEASGRLKIERSGSILSTETYRLNRTRTQGFVAAHGRFYYNHSYRSDQHRIHIQRPDGYSTLRGGYGLEDIHYDGDAGRLWFLTEHPRNRGVFFIESPHWNL